MKNSEIKPGQLFGATWITGPDKGQRVGFRIRQVWLVYGIFHVTATNVKTNVSSVFGFKGEDVPRNWVLIEDAVPSQSNSK